MRKHKNFAKFSTIPCFCVDHLKISFLLWLPTKNFVTLHMLFLFSGMLFSGLFPYIPSFTHYVSAQSITSYRKLSDLPDPCYRVTSYVQTAVLHVFLCPVAVSFRVLSAPGGWTMCLLLCVSSVTGTDQALDKLLFHEWMLTFLVPIPPSPVWKSKKIFHWDRWLLKLFSSTCKLVSFNCAF